MTGLLVRKCYQNVLYAKFSTVLTVSFTEMMRSIPIHSGREFTGHPHVKY